MDNVKKNYFYSLFYQLLAIIIPIITTPYVSRVLGATAIGDYNFTFGIVSYFGIFVLTGTQNYGQREIAANNNDQYRKTLVFWEVFLFRAFCVLIVGIIYICFIIYSTKFKTLYTIYLITFISWFLDISWYYQGVENFRFIVIRNTIVKVLGTILIFTLVNNENDLTLYVLVLCLSTLVGNITFWLNIKREIVPVKIRDIDVLSNFKGIMELFIPVIAIQVYTVLDQTMLGILSNTTQVGYYSQGEKIVKLAITVISALSIVLLPRISSLYSERKTEEILKLFKKSISYLFMLANPMFLGCIIINPLFVPVFFGSGFEPVEQVLVILSFLFLVLSVGQLFGSILVAINKQQIYTKAVITAAALNFILNTVFIGYLKLGASGAATATVIAEAICTIIQIAGARDAFPIIEIFKSFIRYSFPSIIMAIILAILVYCLPVTLLSLLLSLFISVLVYCLILLITKDEFFFAIFKSLQRSK